MAFAKGLDEKWVVWITACVAVAYIVFRLVQAGGDPAGLAEIGTRYGQGVPGGTEGYDGQFAYFIALDPNPARVAPHLDVPAYRYQRILYPLLARLLALGQPRATPWALLVVNLGAQLLGTWALARWLCLSGSRPAYALIYGLWVGLIMALGTDLNEPVAFGLLTLGWLSRKRGKMLAGAVLLSASLFAKETGSLFLVAALMGDLFEKRWRRGVAPLFLGLLGFGAWQVWLWFEFGSFGIGSGGAMATPFEVIPLMGFFRIALASPATFVLFALVFGPFVILPSIWGLVEGGRALLAEARESEVWAMLFNALMIVFLPFSTFREPLGLVRIATGAYLSILLFAAPRGRNRLLNYGFLSFALLAMLANG
jgi:hypothetical protein